MTTKLNRDKVSKKDKFLEEEGKNRLGNIVVLPSKNLNLEKKGEKILKKVFTSMGKGGRKYG